MKDLRPALRFLMLSNAQLSTMVGGSRIYPVIMPQGVTSPSVVMNIISEASDYANDGPSNLGNARVQMDSWSQSADTSVQLGSLVHDVLSGFAGTITYGSPSQQVEVQAIFVEQANDAYESSSKLFSRRRDYIVWYVEQ